MLLNFSGWLFTASGVLSGLFFYRVNVFYKKNPNNKVSNYYRIAIGFITFGFLFYGLPSILFGNKFQAIAIGGAIANSLNAIGFGSFLIIPFYNSINRSFHKYLKYSIFLYFLLVIALNILKPAQSFLDAGGAIHWRFSLPVALSMIFIMIAAFILNIIVILNYFRKLSSASCIKALALITAFVFAGLGGAYLYIGDSSRLLILANTLLFFGILAAFFSTIKIKILTTTEDEQDCQQPTTKN